MHVSRHLSRCCNGTDNHQRAVPIGELRMMPYLTTFTWHVWRYGISEYSYYTKCLLVNIIVILHFVECNIYFIAQWKIILHEAKPSGIWIRMIFYKAKCDIYFIIYLLCYIWSYLSKQISLISLIILTVWNIHQKEWRLNKHSLWQQPCGRHSWIDTEYILYKDGIVAPIVGQSQHSTTQFLHFRCCFSDYGNGLAFKQTYTSLLGKWKLMIFGLFWFNIFSTNN